MLNAKIKYASLMATGLLVSISIFAAVMPETASYADLMAHKQHMIKQLNKQVECVRLAEDAQSLESCQGIASNESAPMAVKADKNGARLKSNQLGQREFF